MKSKNSPLSEATLNAIREGFAQNTVGKIRRKKISKDLRMDTREHAPLNNLLFGVDDKGNKFCYIIEQNKNNNELTDIMGVGAFGTVYNAIKVTQGSRGKLSFEPIVVKKLDFNNRTTANQSREAFAGSINAPDFSIENATDKNHFITTELELGKETGLITSAVNTDNKVYIEMPKLDGTELYNALNTAKGAAYSFEDIETIMMNLLREMNGYHKKGIRHNDLKPENILISDNLSTHVIDWGLGEYPAVGITNDAILGTPGYMAPEAITSSPVRSEASDVYALGAILLDLLSKQADSSNAIIQDAGRVSANVTFPDKNLYDISLVSFKDRFKENIPAHLITLAKQLTSYDPETRPSCAMAIKTLINFTGFIDFMPGKSREAIQQNQMSLVNTLNTLMNVNTPNNVKDKLKKKLEENLSKPDIHFKLSKKNHAEILTDLRHVFGNENNAVKLFKNKHSSLLRNNGLTSDLEGQDIVYKSKSTTPEMVGNTPRARDSIGIIEDTVSSQTPPPVPDRSKKPILKK